MASKTLKFITGNKSKFAEVANALAPVKIEQVDIDLEEIQDLDPKKVISHKLTQAFKHYKYGFFIEDTCLYFEAFKNKLPGPFAKFFLEALKPVGLYKLAKSLKNQNAEFVTIIAYVKSPKEIYFYEGSIKGKIVKTRGKNGFGADPVFMPNG